VWIKKQEVVPRAMAEREVRSQPGDGRQGSSPCPPSSQRQQAAHYRNVLEEALLLRHDLLGWHSPKIVKDEGDHHGKNRHAQRRPTGLPTQQDEQAQAQLGGDRQCCAHLW
jgi:hypothetical protein